LVTIEEELGAIRHKPTDKVGKLEIIDKGEVKRLIGRSPDFSDAMAYRMYFEYKTTGVKTFRIG
jgi:phage terminase large subunit